MRRKAALLYYDVERDPDCCRRHYRNRNLVHGGYFRLGSDVAVFGERPIMKIIHVTTGVVCALTMLLLAPLEANAGGRKGGVRVGGHHVVSGHHALARHHFRSFRNQNFGQWPFGYGYGYGDELSLIHI